VRISPFTATDESLVFDERDHMSIPTALSTIFTTRKSIGAIALTATLAIVPAALPAQASTVDASISSCRHSSRASQAADAPE